MGQRLTDRVALVTGSGRGIGEAIAAGWRGRARMVWIADIDEPRAQAAAAMRSRARCRPRSTSPTTNRWRRSPRAIEERHGRLDILVNNAAILDMTSYKDMTIESFIGVHDVNLNGALRVTMAMVPLMRKSRRVRDPQLASVNGCAAAAIRWPTRPPRAESSTSRAASPASSPSTASGSTPSRRASSARECR